MGQTKIVLDDKRLKRLQANLRPAAGRAVMETAHEIETGYKLAVQNPPKTGRIYQRGRQQHQASAPGEAPATDTGNLVNSARVERVSELSALVVVNAEYGAALEFGAPYRNLAPRPAMAPAAEEARPHWHARMEALFA